MILELIRKLDLTQVQMAERLGVSRVTVNRWVNLVQMPSKKNLKKIADLEDMIEGYQDKALWYFAVKSILYFPLDSWWIN